MPTLQPVIPPEDVRDMNETATELENGVENDLVHELDNSANTTQILRNEENDDLLTVTTTIGLNVRDHTQNTSGGSEQQNDGEAASTTARGFTPGQGSVEVTRVTQESAVDTDPRNLTVSDGSEGPNSSGSFGILFVAILPVLMNMLF